MSIAHLTARIGPLLVSLSAASLYFLLFPPRFFEGMGGLFLASSAIFAFFGIAGVILSRQRFVIPGPGLLLVLFMLSSALWSSSAEQTAKTGFFYAALFVLAVSFAPSEKYVRIGIALAVSTLALASLPALILFLLENPPSRVFAGFPGPYGNRNGFAFVLISGLPALVSIIPGRRAMRIARGSIIALVAVLVILTRSETGLAALLVIGAVWAVMRFQKRVRLWSVFLVLLAPVSAFALLLLSPAVLAVIGKDPTISGRTTLWGVVMDSIERSPIFGMGWANSWPDNSAVFMRLQELGMPLHHSHNEMLNWLLTLGLLGLVLVCFIYVSVIIGGVKVFNLGHEGLGMWAVLTGVAFFVRGLSEISETNAQGWFIWLLVYAAVMHALNREGSGSVQLAIWPNTETSRAKAARKH